MNHRRGLRALGISILAALGLMAFTAGGAQAQSFLVQNLTPPWSNIPVVGEGENVLDSYLLILKLNVKLTCHTVSASGTINSNGHGIASLEFSNCLVVDSEGETVACTFPETIKANALALVILHRSNLGLAAKAGNEDKPYILFEPIRTALEEAKKEFNTVFAKVTTSGEFCTLPPTADVKGSVVTWISNPDGDDVSKLISTKAIPPIEKENPKPTMLELFTGDVLTYGAHISHLIADANVVLDGDKHKGLAWGAA